MQQDAAGTLPQPPADLSRAEAMAAYTRSVIEPLVAVLERSQARVSELERENGTLAERLAGLERVRDAAMAHAAELEQRLEAAAARPPEPEPAEEIAALRAEHDRHTAELERADATLAGQAASHARVSRRARLLAITLALVAAVLVLAAMLAPAWVR